MSRKYKQSSEVPNNVLIKRLEEISDACTKGHKEIARTFVMRIPAEVDFCPDLVISEAANRLNQLSHTQARLEEAELLLARFTLAYETIGLDDAYEDTMKYLESDQNTELLGD